MPIGPNIAIIGAGNRLAAIPVLATVFNLPPDMGDRITLCDRHAEMLGRNLGEFGNVARDLAAADNRFDGSVHTVEDVLIIHAGVYDSRSATR